MDEFKEIVLRINLKISSVDHPQLAQYLQSEPNQMRRTRKLCQLATRGLLVKDNNLAAPHIIAQRISSPQLVTDSQNKEEQKSKSKVVRRSDKPMNTNSLIDDSIFGDIKCN